MSTLTTNYGLTKPDGTEYYDVSVSNSNLDIVDAKLKENADNLTAHLSETAYYEQYKITANQLISNNTLTNIVFTNRTIPTGLTDKNFAKVNINGQIELVEDGVYDLQVRSLAFEANADGERMFMDAGAAAFGCKPTSISICNFNSTVTAKLVAGYVLGIAVAQSSGTNLNIITADVRIMKR